MGINFRSKKVTLTSGMLAAVIATGAVTEHWNYEAKRQTLMTSAAATAVEMRPAPINPAWIIEGTPKTEVAQVAETYDSSTKVYVWKTTAAKFKWYYDADEVVTILDGDVFIKDQDGQTRHLKAGDVALFPVGAVLEWTVPDHVTKSAIVKRVAPKPFEIAMRWLRSARRLISPEQAFAG